MEVLPTAKHLGELAGIISQVAIPKPCPKGHYDAWYDWASRSISFHRLVAEALWPSVTCAEGDIDSVPGDARRALSRALADSSYALVAATKHCGLPVCCMRAYGEMACLSGDVHVATLLVAVVPRRPFFVRIGDHNHTKTPQSTDQSQSQSQNQGHNDDDPERRRLLAKAFDILAEVGEEIVNENVEGMNGEPFQ